jgi:serine-type D-Ala-D-Ala carboxypeptidase
MVLFTALILAVGDPLRGGLPEREPASLGMSAVRLSAIERVVQRGIDAGGYPGASVVVGRKGFSVLSRGFGSLDWTGRTRVSVQESIYDLASLTKVIATTTAMMVLFDQGRLNLDAPVSRYLPDFSGGLKDQVTVRHLLTHRGGLPAGRELWRIARTPAQARAAVIATPVGCTPGVCYEYSDLGADLLGFIAEAISGQPLDQFLEREVFSKLGMSDTHFRLSASDAARSAPTEIAPPRGYPLRGEVHDENAWALGGVAGHAGLFSTASDLSVFAQMLLEGGKYAGVRVISDSTVALFTRRAAGRRALGWDTCDGGAGCGQHLSERAFGHTGFTGTSIWIDPDRQVFVILLTNRVHAARATRPSKVIADVRNDLADAAVLAVLDAPGGVLAMPVSFRADVAADWNRPLRSARARSTAASRRASAARRAKGAKSRPTATSSRARALAKAGSSKAVVKGRSTTPARASTAVAASPKRKSAPIAKKKVPTMKAATAATKKTRH